MNDIICKYRLLSSVSDDALVIEHDTPEGAAFLDVQVQSGDPVMWWCVDPDRPRKRRAFVIIGTGIQDEISEGMAYLGTFQID